MPPFPPAPLGGVLVNRLAAPDRIEALRRDLPDWPSWALTDAQAAGLELVMNGACSPLTGFMRRDAVAGVTKSLQLPDGTPWPVPIALAVTEATASAAGTAGRLVLREGEGRALAVLLVEERWDAGGEHFVGGPVDGLDAPTHYDFLDGRRTPADVRHEVLRRGWRAALAIVAEGAGPPADRPALIDAARSLDAGVVLFVADTSAGPAGLAAYRRFRWLHDWIAAFPVERRLLCVLPWVSASDSRRSIAFQAIVARNYGCSHLAAVGEAVSDVPGGGAGIVRLPAATEQGAAAAGSRPGGTVFFTGLSGAGKSTIANALRIRLLEEGREVSLLDGDLVRRHLSSELGFSRAHRELNVRRMAFVAAEIARHGGLAICAPIAPYDNVRQQARRIVEEAGIFLLVYVDTPLEVCESRDPKGLYARARAGHVPEFTGISDPYEIPPAPDLTVHAAHGSPQQAVDQILALLRTKALF